MGEHKRLENAKKVLEEQGADALLLEDEINLFYLTGLELSAGKLLIGHTAAVLFVDGRYLELCQSRSPIPVKLLDPSKFSQNFLQPPFDSVRTLAFASDKLSYDGYIQLQKQLKPLPHPIALMPLQTPLRPLRLYKEPEEAEKLKAAARLGSAGFELLLSLLQEGIREDEAAAELEIFWKRQGAASAFSPIIAFGPNSSMPHHRAGKTRLEKGQPVLIDIGATLDHYHSDMTRTLFFESADPQLLAFHEVVQEAQAAALKLCRPGTPLGALDRAARSLIEKAGYGERFTHSLGHGIGLEVHEYPTVKNTEPFKDVLLEPGMALTIEPGIYLPGIGGVRIEDTVLITETGHENLTNLPSSAFIIRNQR
jgi:Xaa-Pro aminopeptidase